MGVVKKNDGRYIVGTDVTTANEYNGSLGWRDIFIQLTADGATADSVEKLEYLRDYAIYHSGKGEPVMPPGVSVWLSNNGTTAAVEADDISYTDGVYTICGIKYENGAWDFSNAGQGGGGSSLPPVTDADNGDVLGVVDGAWGKMEIPRELPDASQASDGDTLTVDNGDWTISTPKTESLTVIATGECVYDSANSKWTVGIDKTPADIVKCYDANTGIQTAPVFANFPHFKTTSPYYDYMEGQYFSIIPNMDAGRSVKRDVGAGVWEYGLQSIDGSLKIVAFYTSN